MSQAFQSVEIDSRSLVKQVETGQQHHSTVSTLPVVASSTGICASHPNGVEIGIGNERERVIPACRYGQGSIQASFIHLSSSASDPQLALITVSSLYRVHLYRFIACSTECPKFTSNARPILTSRSFHLPPSPHSFNVQRYTAFSIPCLDITSSNRATTQRSPNPTQLSPSSSSPFSPRHYSDVSLTYPSSLSPSQRLPFAAVGLEKKQFVLLSL